MSSNDETTESARIETAWRGLADLLRKELSAAGLKESAVDWILTDLRPRHIEIMLRTPPVTSPFPFGELREEVRALFARNTVASITQMVRLERELFEAQFGTDALFEPGAREAQAGSVLRADASATLN